MYVSKDATIERQTGRLKAKHGNKGFCMGIEAGTSHGSMGSIPVPNVSRLSLGIELQNGELGLINTTSLTGCSEILSDAVIFTRLPEGFARQFAR